MYLQSHIIADIAQIWKYSLSANRIALVAYKTKGDKAIPHFVYPTAAKTTDK